MTSLRPDTNTRAEAFWTRRLDHCQNRTEQLQVTRRLLTSTATAVAQAATAASALGAPAPDPFAAPRR